MTQVLTQIEFTDDDFDKAQRIAKALGYSQTAYTSSSILIGLFCLPNHAKHRSGCIIKTEELGLMFVQDIEDMLLAERIKL